MCAFATRSAIRAPGRPVRAEGEEILLDPHEVGIEIGFGQVSATAPRQAFSSSTSP